MQVGGVNVAVCDYSVLGEGGECCDDACFAGTAFSAYDDYFFQDETPIIFPNIDKP